MICVSTCSEIRSPKTSVKIMKKRPTQVAKDKSGNVTKYKTTITIVVELIENEKTIKKRSFSKNFNYSNLSNKFELKKYQEGVETNLINSIVRDIKIFLN